MPFEFYNLEDDIANFIAAYIHSVVSPATAAIFVYALKQELEQPYNKLYSKERTFTTTIPTSTTKLRGIEPQDIGYKVLSSNKDDDNSIIEISFSNLFSLCNTMTIIKNNDKAMEIFKKDMDLRNSMLLAIIRGLSIDALLVFKSSGAFNVHKYKAEFLAIEIFDKLIRLQDEQRSVIAKELDLQAHESHTPGACVTVADEESDTRKRNAKINTQALNIFKDFFKDDKLLIDVAQLQINILLSTPVTQPMTFAHIANLSDLQDKHDEFIIAVIEFAAKYPSFVTDIISEYSTLNAEYLIAELLEFGREISVLRSDKTTPELPAMLKKLDEVQAGLEHIKDIRVELEEMFAKVQNPGVIPVTKTTAPAIVDDAPVSVNLRKSKAVENLIKHKLSDDHKVKIGLESAIHKKSL